MRWLFALLFTPAVCAQNINGNRLMATVKDITGFSEQSRKDGLLLWGRIAGTKYAHDTARYMRKRFEQVGLKDVRMDKFPTRYPQWWPIEWELKAGGQRLSSAVAAHPAGEHPTWGSPPTPAQGLEAPLVWLGEGTEADLDGRDVKGKIAVLRSYPWPNGNTHTAQAAAPRLKGRGLAGLIVILDIPGNFQTLGNFSCGLGPCEAPAFEVGMADGLILEAAAARRETASMKLILETKTGFEDYNVMGLLPGTTDEYVILTAHTDGWFEGASDNASGLATLLELAAYFANRPRRRNLLFVATSGHHAGSPGTRFLVENYPGLMKKTAFVLNCEHMATSLFLRYGSYQSGRPAAMMIRSNTEYPRSVIVPNAGKALVNAVLDAARKHGITLAGRMVTNTYPGDIKHFGKLKIPAVALMDGSPLAYHISGDLAALTEEGLERAARGYAAILERADQLSFEEMRK